MKLSSSKLPWLQETVSPIEIRTACQDNRRSARTPPGQVVDRSNARPPRRARARLGLPASRNSGSLPREQKVPRMVRRLMGVRQIPGRHPNGMAGGPGVHPKPPATADKPYSRYPLRPLARSTLMSAARLSPVFPAAAIAGGGLAVANRAGPASARQTAPGVRGSRVIRAPVSYERTWPSVFRSR